MAIQDPWAHLHAPPCAKHSHGAAVVPRRLGSGLRRRAVAAAGVEPRSFQPGTGTIRGYQFDGLALASLTSLRPRARERSSCGRWAYRRTRRSSTTCTVSTLTRWIWCPSPCSPLFSASLIHPRYVGRFSSPNQESRHIGHARETYFPLDFGEIRAPIRLFTQTSASMSSFRITHQASPLPVPKPVLSVIPFFFWKGGGVLIAGVQAMMRHWGNTSCWSAVAWFVTKFTITCACKYINPQMIMISHWTLAVLARHVSDDW